MLIPRETAVGFIVFRRITGFSQILHTTLGIQEGAAHNVRNFAQISA
jgi:hypothetical protein